MSFKLTACIQQMLLPRPLPSFPPSHSSSYLYRANDQHWEPAAKPLPPLPRMSDKQKKELFPCTGLTRAKLKNVRIFGKAHDLSSMVEDRTPDAYIVRADFKAANGELGTIKANDCAGHCAELRLGSWTARAGDVCKACSAVMKGRKFRKRARAFTKPVDENKVHYIPHRHRTLTMQIKAAQNVRRSSLRRAKHAARLQNNHVKQSAARAKARREEAEEAMKNGTVRE